MLQFFASKYVSGDWSISPLNVFIFILANHVEVANVPDIGTETTPEPGANQMHHSANRRTNHDMCFTKPIKMRNFAMKQIFMNSKLNKESGTIRIIVISTRTRKI